jgi:hypothetical protein
MCPASESSASDPDIHPPMASTIAKPPVSAERYDQARAPTRLRRAARGRGR